ncbi:thiol reductase thioredoxin [candidate division FCPU426 bacterium]|nr:thiol reductase thioredoxin [candidate division FCPU426 bacterium]
MEVTDQTFEAKILKSDMPVMVDFWDEHCTPCHMLWPVVQEFALEFQGRIRVYRLDIEDNPKTAERFAIHSIPSLLFFKNGRLVVQLIGTCTKSRIIAAAEEVLHS